MRILVTNDDGVESPGIHALAAALHADGHELSVVAPSGEHSGSGASIGRLHRSGPLACTVVEWAALPGVPVYAIDAPPAAAVYVGCAGILGDRPDAVASGVNPGANTGHLVLHSGTVGAALTAATLGVPALAVSVAWAEEFHFDTAAAIAAAAIDWVGSGGGETDGVRVLSINVPNAAIGDVLGVREARLARFDERWSGVHTPGEVLLQYDGHAGDADPDTDLALLHAGYATVTRLAGVVSAPAADAADSIRAHLASLGSPA